MDSQKIDSKMNDYMSKSQLRIKFEKMSDRKFRYGTKVVVVRIEDDDSLKIRVGGTWKDIKSFIKE